MMASRAVSRQGQVSRDRPRDNRREPPPEQQEPWMIDRNRCLVLTQELNPFFKAGDRVIVTGHVPLPGSPTSYPGQDALPRNKANTLYRIEKWHTYEYKDFIQSEDYSTVITGNRLSLISRGRGDPYASFEPGQLVYVVGDVPDVRVRQYGQTFKIPYNTRAMIVGPTSRGGMNAQLSTAARHTRPWVLWYRLDIVKREWLHCQSFATSGHLREATTEEYNEWSHELRKPPLTATLGNMEENDRPPAR